MNGVGTQIAVKEFMKAGLVDQAYQSCTEMAEDAANQFGLSTDEGAEVWEWAFDVMSWWDSLGEHGLES
jgi:hypothetical protein